MNLYIVKLDENIAMYPERLIESQFFDYADYYFCTHQIISNNNRITLVNEKRTLCSLFKNSIFFKRSLPQSFSTEFKSQQNNSIVSTTLYLFSYIFSIQNAVIESHLATHLHLQIFNLFSVTNSGEEDH